MIISPEREAFEAGLANAQRNPVNCNLVYEGKRLLAAADNYALLHDQLLEQPKALEDAVRALRKAREIVCKNLKGAKWRKSLVVYASLYDRADTGVLDLARRTEAARKEAEENSFTRFISSAMHEHALNAATTCNAFWEKDFMLPYAGDPQLVTRAVNFRSAIPLRPGSVSVSIMRALLASVDMKYLSQKNMKSYAQNAEFDLV